MHNGHLLLSTASHFWPLPPSGCFQDLLYPDVVTVCLTRHLLAVAVTHHSYRFIVSIIFNCFDDLKVAAASIPPFLFVEFTCFIGFFLQLWTIKAWVLIKFTMLISQKQDTNINIGNGDFFVDGNNEKIMNYALTTNQCHWEIISMA